MVSSARPFTSRKVSAKCTFSSLQIAASKAYESTSPWTTEGRGPVSWPSNMTTLYIHGFASTGASSTAAKLREILGPDESVLAPTLTHRPAADLETLADIVRTENVTVVVGSSLGGFYALAIAQKFGLPVVLINPSLGPYETLGGVLGTVAVYGTSDTFQWTQEQLDELREIADAVGTAIDIETSGLTWSKVLVLLGGRDEVLDPQATAAKFPNAHVILDPDAGHRFGDISAYAELIRAVAAA